MSAPVLDKAAVTAAVLALFREELASLDHMTQLARDEATSPESRPENKYDTRATEASYLAAGQGQRLVALRRLVAFLESHDGSRRGLALFTLEGERGPAWFLLAPDGGGRRVSVDGHEVVVVTGESPVGAALAGCREGDEVKLGPPGAQSTWEVVSIA